MKPYQAIILIIAMYSFAGWLDNQAQADDQQTLIGCVTDSECGCTDDCLISED